MIPRTILPYIEHDIPLKPVILITGARQVGKTTLCEVISKKYGFNYVSLADRSERSMAAAVLLMIEAPVIFSQTDDRITDAPLARRLMLLLAVAAAGLGVWLFFQYVLRENGRGQVETATLLWIGSVLLFHAGSSGGGTDSESGGTGGDE